MDNSIEARIDFSFKGEDYELRSVIDLDKLLEQYDSMPSIYEILAHAHGIDTYSYLYEVMLAADIEFADALGFANDLIVDGEFDQHALEDNWQNLRILTLLRPVASSILGIANLEQHETIKNALIQAYLLGSNNSHWRTYFERTP